MYNHASMIPDECRHSNAPPLHAAAHAPLAARDHLPAASHLTRVDRACPQVDGAARWSRLAGLVRHQPLPELN